MYHFFIRKYIQNITEKDIIKFALSQGIELSESEVKLFYHHVKQNWETVLYGDPTTLFQAVKSEIRPETYQKMIELYQYFKEKYQSYL